MAGQTQDFFHHYRAMDTHILLARYRNGGLLPEANAALLEVLADRGHTVEMLKDKVANQITTSSAEGIVEANSVAMKAWRSLPIAGQWLRRKVKIFALLVRERVRLWETWAQVARISLLVVCWWSVLRAGLFGVGLFVIANVFCDSGPLMKCFHMGLHFLEVGGMAEVLLIPIICALLFPMRWIAEYLKAVPLLSLAVFVAAIHWYRVLPMFCATAAELSALIAFLATAYLILSWKSALAQKPNQRERGN